MLRAAIYERDWNPPCIIRRSLSRRQWRTHMCVSSDNRRLVAIIKPCLLVWRTPGERTERFLDEGRHGMIKLYLASILFMPNLLNANSAEPTSNL